MTENHSSAAVQQRSPGRPSHAEAVRLRQNFMQIALEAFLQEGYAGCSMDGIARRAKVSKNTVYLQYGTKNELFRAAALHGLAAVRTQLGTSIQSGKPAAEGLLSIIRQIQAQAADPALRGLTRLLIAESQRFPDIAAALLAEVDTLFEPVAAHLRAQTKRGELHISDPGEAALDLVFLAVGGLRFLLAEPPSDPEALEARARSVLQIVLSGWSPKPFGKG